MKKTLLVAICCAFLVSCTKVYGFENYLAENAVVICLVLVGIWVMVRLTKHEIGKQDNAMYSHYYFSFENVNISGKEFYEELQTIIKEKEFPDINMRYVSLLTGIFSAKRQYLQITFDECLFFVGASPYGKNFFISYRLNEMHEGCWNVFSRRVFGWEQGKSFYQVDLELMFKKSIESAIKEAIHRVTETRGIKIDGLDTLQPQINV